jgi:hypothetical protein
MEKPVRVCGDYGEGIINFRLADNCLFTCFLWMGTKGQGESSSSPREEKSLWIQKHKREIHGPVNSV